MYYYVNIKEAENYDVEYGNFSFCIDYILKQFYYTTISKYYTFTKNKEYVVLI